MTRENKLALVVGFGLILFVGILISDHFAPSPNRTNAELGDPSLAARGQRERALTELSPRPPVAGNSGGDLAVGGLGGGTGRIAGERTLGNEGGGPLPDDGLALGPGIHVPGGPEPLSPEEARARLGRGGQRGEGLSDDLGPAADRLYVVRQGDTLYGISRRELGDGAQWTRIRDANGLKESQPLRVGSTLRLPGGSGEVSRVAFDPGRRDATPPAAPREYTVREGDTLSSIAERFLGKRSRWQELFELNRSRLKDPNQVAPGTRLTLPSTAGTGTRA